MDSTLWVAEDTFLGELGMIVVFDGYGLRFFGDHPIFQDAGIELLFTGLIVGFFIGLIFID